jgi:hypothetical protein
MYKVRFNLGSGKNYMKWKVDNLEDKTNEYLEPDKVSLTLINCTLKNNRNRSEEIFLGAHKSVCAWVLCENVIIGPPKEIIGTIINYNPRVNPHWSENGKDIDGKFFEELNTINKNVIYENKYNTF